MRRDLGGEMTSEGNVEARGGPDFPAELAARFPPVRLLGQGGMGAVFLARDRELDRLVAVKVLLGSAPAETRTRFRREADALARVRHGNLVEVYASGEGPAGPWLAMEYLDGRPLSEGVGDRDPLEVMLGIARGLEARGPAGRGGRGRVPATHRGSAAGRGGGRDLGLVQGGTGEALTRTGAVVGTIAYMAPEALVSGAASPASDWFSWGLCLYQLLEGRHPWATDPKALETLLSGRIPPWSWGSEGKAGSRVRALVEACLAADPARRPKDLAAVLGLLEKGTGPRTRPFPTRPSTPGTKPRGRGAARLLGGLGVAGAASVAIWALVPSGVPEAAGSGGGGVRPEAAPVGVDAVLDPGMPERIREEVAAWARSGRPGVERVAVGVSRHLTEEGASRFVVDPAGIPAVLESLPALSAVLAWLARGGKPEAAGGEWIRGFEAVDRDLEEQGIHLALSPMLTVRPSPGRTPPFSWISRAIRELAPGEISGWALTMATVDVETELKRLQAEHREQGLRRGILGTTLSEVTSLKEALRGGFADGERRAWFQPRLAKAEADLRRLVYAAGRAVRDRPEEAGFVALLARGQFRYYAAAFYGSVAFLPVEGLLGGVAEGRPGSFLEAALVERMADVREDAGLDFAPLRRREVELLQRVIAPPFPGRVDRALAIAALGRLVQYVGESGPYPGFEEDVRVREVLLPEAHAALGVDLLEGMASVWRSGHLGFDAGDLDRAEAFLDRNTSDEGTRGDREILKRDLERLRSRVR